MKVEQPWRGYRVFWYLWLGVMGIVVVLSPIMAFDVVVLLPLGMCIALAGPKLRELARTPPSCRRCKLSLAKVPDVPGGTG